MYVNKNKNIERMFYMGRQVYTGKNWSSLLQKIEDKYAKEGSFLLLEEDFPNTKSDGSHSTQNHSSSFTLFLRQKQLFSSFLLLLRNFMIQIEKFIDENLSALSMFHESNYIMFNLLLILEFMVYLCMPLYIHFCIYADNF